MMNRLPQYSPHFARFAILCALLAGNHAVRAQDTPFVNDPEPPTPRSVKPGRKWQEGPVTLPSWPRDSNLIEIKLDNNSGPFRYYIDPRSLTNGNDDVVRYTVVAETSNGTRNVSYEGLRCTPTGAVRTYAYGTADKRFSRIPEDLPWIRPDRTAAPYHDELWRHYLCVRRLFQPRPKKEQLRLLRNGRVPSQDNSGFLTN